MIGGISSTFKIPPVQKISLKAALSKFIRKARKQEEFNGKPKLSSKWEDFAGRVGSQLATER
jgi:hypothetical protein